MEAAPQFSVITPGKAATVNFAALTLRDVRIDLRWDAFEAADSRLKPQSLSRIDSLIGILNEAPSHLRITYFKGTEDRELARARAGALKDIVAARWAETRKTTVLPLEIVIDDRNE